MCDTTYFLSDLLASKTQAGITSTNLDTDTLYKKQQGKKDGSRQQRLMEQKRYKVYLLSTLQL